VIKQGIVESISPRHVGRLLAGADLKPHQSQYWLSPPPTLSSRTCVKDICEVYRSAIERAERGERTISTDEMTGIQALERSLLTNPCVLACRELREFEYIRHGTQTLIASA